MVGFVDANTSVATFIRMIAAAARSTARPSPCAYRKSHPAILMVKSAEDRAADDIPNPLDAARDWGILVQ
jgi:hypothetical protein